MSTGSIDLLLRCVREHADEIADAIWKKAFATERACMAVHALHFEIDSSLLAKMPFMEDWTKYANQKTQGEE